MMDFLRHLPGAFADGYLSLYDRANRSILEPGVSGYYTMQDNVKALRIRRIFERTSPVNPQWLGLGELERLDKEYPPGSDYGSDEASLEKRGQERAEEILQLLPGGGEFMRFLELGCRDGMVSYSLERRGKHAWGIDVTAAGFDGRALRGGASLSRMDAVNLAFDESSFDCVFSYNSFEHFKRPDAVLDEAIRVLRPGGYVYLDFGPLYMSPLGLHIFRQIGVPYAQLLFRKETLTEFARMNRTTINMEDANGWLLEDYRNLWERCGRRLRKIRCEEVWDFTYLDIVARYPGCFSGKVKSFDDLTASYIKVLFKKR
jgi:SAM-dependent methyltransferase